MFALQSTLIRITPSTACWRLSPSSTLFLVRRSSARQSYRCSCCFQSSVSSLCSLFSPSATTAGATHTFGCPPSRPSRGSPGPMRRRASSPLRSRRNALPLPALTALSHKTAESLPRSLPRSSSADAQARGLLSAAPRPCATARPRATKPRLTSTGSRTRRRRKHTNARLHGSPATSTTATHHPGGDALGPALSLGIFIVFRLIDEACHCDGSAVMYYRD